MVYQIDATNPTGKKGTIYPDVGFQYSDILNEMNEATIKISGTSINQRTLMVIGSQIDIYDDGTLVFKGKVDDINNLEAGALSFHVSGFEFWLAKENGAYASSPYTSTASATIFSDVIGESNYFTTGTINAGLSIDFRLNNSQSLFNAITNLLRRTQQDLQIDYTNDEVDILDHRGSSSVVATLNDGLQISNIRVQHAYPLGNYIEVLGKADGDNQIKSESGHGQDGTSQSSYGIIKRQVIDRSVMTVAEANILADAELALTKDPEKIYDFDLNYNISLDVGDHVNLNSEDHDLSSEEVRIVAITKGKRGDNIFATIQVTNPAYKTAMKTRSKILAGLQKNNTDNNSYMQGSGNTLIFSEQINANNSAPLRIGLQLPSNFIEDEAGNIRVNSFTLDYDVDKFRKSIGTASESDNAPSLTGGATSSHKHDVTDSGHLHAVPAHTTPNTEIITSEGDDSDSSFTARVGWNNDVVTATFSGSGIGYICAKVVIIASFSNSDFDVGIRIHNSTFYHVNRCVMNASTGLSTYVVRETFLFPYFASTGSDSLKLDLYSSVNGDYGVYIDLYAITEGHTHSITQFNANSNNADVSDSNKTPALTGTAASHNHSVSVGDAVSDGDSLNATQISEIKLYYYNTGTSVWDLKNTITNTGKTIDTDVDLSDSGTYPDATGYWKVEIKTDNASPDLVKGIVKLKHSLDN